MPLLLRDNNAQTALPDALYLFLPMKRFCLRPSSSFSDAGPSLPYSSIHVPGILLQELVYHVKTFTSTVPQQVVIRWKVHVTLHHKTIRL